MNIPTTKKRLGELEGRSPDKPGKIVGVVCHDQTTGEIETFLDNHGVSLVENDRLIVRRIVEPKGKHSHEPIEFRGGNYGDGDTPQAA